MMSQDNTPARRNKKLRVHGSLVHGIYAKEIVLPWESRDDFERLHSDLKLEFSPQGRAEEEAVLDLATLHWQKRTLWRLRQAAVLRDPFTQEIVQTRKKSWPGIRKRLREAAKDERSFAGAMEGNFAKLAGQMQRLQEKIESSSKREELETLESNLRALTEVMSEHAIPLLQMAKGGPNPEQTFESAYAPECLEKLYQLEAALDARLAKVLSRLVGIKEFKRTPAGGNLQIARGSAS